MTCELCGDEDGQNRESCPGCRAFLARSAPARPPASGERRDLRHQYAIIGGDRLSDPPLTTRECADWMGFSTDWVRAAIDEGVMIEGELVKLEAETLTINGRRVHRIHLDRFVAFLQAIHWKRIPRRPPERAAVV